MSVVDAQLKAYIRAEFDAQFPFPPTLSPAQVSAAGIYRDKLVSVLASGVIYLRDNASVKTGIHVAVTQTSPGVFDGITDEVGTLE